MDEFTSFSQKKIFQGFKITEQIYSSDVMTLRDLKRIRLDEDVQMLALPRYQVKQVKETMDQNGKFQKVKVDKKMLKDFVAVIYIGEDRLLTDMIYDFKAIRDYPQTIQSELISQKNYKSILQYTIMTPNEMEKIQSTRYQTGRSMYPFKSKKMKRCLFTMIGRQITVNDVLLKDVMDLSGAHIFMDHDPANSLPEQPDVKRFKILSQKGKKPIVQKGTYYEHILGCETIESLIEWLSLLQVIQNCSGKFNMRQSEAYLDKLHKMAVL